MTKPSLIVTIALVFSIAGGIYGYESTKDPIAATEAQIDDDREQLIRNDATIAQLPALKVEYSKLFGQYVRNAHSVADMEITFDNALSDVARRDHVVFGSASFDSAIVAAPANAPAGPASVAQQAVDLGGTAAGDPRTDRPNILTDLFVRIPTHLTMKGSWRSIAIAIQDLTHNASLLAITDPDVHYGHKDEVTLAMTAQILGPHVPILTTDLAAPQGSAAHLTDDTGRHAAPSHGSPAPAVKPPRRLAELTHKIAAVPTVPIANVAIKNAVAPAQAARSIPSPVPPHKSVSAAAPRPNIEIAPSLAKSSTSVARAPRRSELAALPRPSDYTPTQWAQHLTHIEIWKTKIIPKHPRTGSRHGFFRLSSASIARAASKRSRHASRPAPRDEASRSTPAPAPEITPQPDRTATPNTEDGP